MGQDSAGVRSYRDLRVWRLGVDFADQVYDATDKFPSREQFRLTSQLIRSANSVPSNIAEGHARRSTREYLYHLSVAIGSLAESETQLEIARRRRFLDESAFNDLMALADEIGKMIRGLQRSLARKLPTDHSSP